MTVKTSSPSDKLNRSFGLVMAGGIAGIAVLRYITNGVWTWWLLGMSVCFLVATLVLPNLLAPVRQVWMRLATTLGFVNQQILLTVVFATVITPIAVLLRLFGKRPIRLQGHGAVSSYWHPRRAEEFTPARMERQF